VRHLYGIALASVMTLVMFFAGAWGYERLLRLPAPSGSPAAALPAGGGSLLSSHAVLYAVAAVAATGVLAGILVAAPRVSPLAAGLTGLLLIGWTALYLYRVQPATDLIPLKSYAFGAGWEALLFNGILAAVGLAMIIPLFIPSRWRSLPYDGTDSEASEASDYIADLKQTAVPAAPTQFIPAGFSASRSVGPSPVRLLRRSGPAGGS
jgi:hypothetical protein